LLLSGWHVFIFTIAGKRNNLLGKDAGNRVNLDARKSRTVLPTMLLVEG
jgi:hypothetical protein